MGEAKERMKRGDLRPKGGSVMEWISVEDRLPGVPVSDVIMYKSETQQILIGEYDSIAKLFIHKGYRKSFITHWMPLPEPPEEVV